MECTYVSSSCFSYLSTQIRRLCRIFLRRFCQSFYYLFFHFRCCRVTESNHQHIVYTHAFVYYEPFYALCKNCSLSRSDITLDQPVHHLSAFQVFHYLIDASFLCSRERVRQRIYVRDHISIFGKCYAVFPVFYILSCTLEGFAPTGSDVLMGVVSTYLLAFVQAGASVFNQLEHWPLPKALLCHFGVLYLAYSICYIANRWIPFDPLVLVIFTADCTPILLHDRVTGAVGAVHAGWRGTALDIAGKAVAAMVEQFGCDPKNIHAAIGPNIGVCCFETGGEVPQAMVDTFGDEARRWIFPTGDKYYVNLKEINRHALSRRGVGYIDVSDACTACQSARFWSHRVTGGNRGSQGAIIVCKEKKE